MFQAVKSWEVGTNGSKQERSVQSNQLKKGWEEYERLFKEYKSKWEAEEIDEHKIAREIMEAASKLRQTYSNIWCSSVKAKIPELFAGIFFLYAILRSGASYKRCQEATHKAGVSHLDDEHFSAEDPELSHGSLPPKITFKSFRLISQDGIRGSLNYNNYMPILMGFPLEKCTVWVGNIMTPLGTDRIFHCFWMFVVCKWKTSTCQLACLLACLRCLRS